MLPFKTIHTEDPLFSQVRIESILRETKQASTFVISAPHSLPYQPGQFLTFVFQLQNKQERRSYSISSCPEWQEPLAVTVKRLANGAFSRPLLDYGLPGDLLTIVGGASGFFTLPPSPATFDQIIFVAAGSGITPVFSLIKSAIYRYSQIPLFLIYSNTSQEKAIFRKPLIELQKIHADRFKIEWLFSNDQDLKRARLNKSLLAELLRKYRKTTSVRILVYLCGPFDYMRMAAIVLQSAGIPGENIKREIFTPELPVSRARPPDVKPHQVEIRIHRKVHRLTVQYPDSILAAAKKVGIELPYSCEAGRCGSCVASCTRGEIWMKYNEVLTDREIEKGRVLICNGFPVGGDVAIEYDS